MMETLRPLSSAAGAFALLAGPILGFGVNGDLHWFVVGLAVLFAAGASFASSVGFLMVPLVVLLLAAIRFTDSAVVLAGFGIAAVGAIWLVDVSRDARRRALVDPRVVSERRRAGLVVVVASLVLVGVSSFASGVGNDAGIYLPFGLFTCAGLVGLVARWIARRSESSASDQFAPGRRA